MSRGGVYTRSDSFNVSAPGANTNILTTSITPSQDGFFVVLVVLATSSVFNYTDTQSSTTFTCGLNKSNALNAGDTYCFTFPVTATSAYNFQVETNGVIRRLQVLECSDFGTAQSAQGT